MSESATTIDFLTSKENLAPVLEIMRHADGIRAKAFSLFWKALAERLQSTVPASLAEEQLSWKTVTKPAESVSKFASISLYVAGSEDQPQSLGFCIEQTNDPKYFELYFGLHWKEETASTSATAKIKEVVALRAFQKSIGFELDENTWWWGWKFIEETTTAQDFLLKFATSPDMIKDTAAMFWAFVEQAHQHVVNTNRAIANVSRALKV
jgi:hypothetical protein